MPRHPEAIIEDLRRDAREYDMHRGDYFLIDALFNQPADWAKRLCEALIRFEHEVLFYAIVEPTPDFDGELAGLMRRAGCLMVTSLVGSVDEGMIERMTRPFGLDDVHRCFGFLDQARVPYMVQDMWGGPGETRETVLENFRQATRWKAVTSMASYGLRIMPGAGLFAVARGEGVVDESTDLLQPTFYLSEPLRDDHEWLDLQVKRMNRFRLHTLPQWSSLLWRGMKAGRQKATT